MSSPMPDDLGSRGAESMTMEDRAERSANVMSGGSQAMEGESPEAKQAKMEAQKYAKLARDASMRYARLAPNQANVRPQSLHNKMQLAADSDAQERSIYRTEIAVGATTVANQLVSSLPLYPDKWHGRVGAAAIRWAPLWFLPAKHGTSGFQKLISRPAVWGGALVAASAGIREIVEIPKGRKANNGGPIRSFVERAKELRDGFRPRLPGRSPRELEQWIDGGLAAVERFHEQGRINDEEYATLRKRVLEEL